MKTGEEESRERPRQKGLVIVYHQHSAWQTGPRGLPASGFPFKTLVCWRQPLSTALRWAWAFWAAPRPSFFATSTDHSCIFCCATHTAARRQGRRGQQPTWDDGARGKHAHQSLADPCTEGGYLRKYVCTSGFEPKAKRAEIKAYF